MSEPIHGETYCGHCEEYVLLCSHGMGIDYAELLKRAEKKLERADKIIRSEFGASLDEVISWGDNNAKQNDV